MSVVHGNGSVASSHAIHAKAMQSFIPPGGGLPGTPEEREPTERLPREAARCKEAARSVSSSLSIERSAGASPNLNSIEFKIKQDMLLKTR